MARLRRSAIARPALQYQGSVELKGLREYSERLYELGDGMLEVGVVQGLGKGADVMRDAARRFAPVLQMPDPRRKPGTLRAAVQALRSKVTHGHSVTFVIGVRLLSSSAVRAFKVARARAGQRWSGALNPNDPFYGSVLELGKTDRTRHPFLRPGFSAAAVQALRVATDHLRGYTEAAIRRLGAR
jgi:hypothetical protein